MELAKHCEFLYTIDPSLVSLEFAKTTNHLHIQDFFNLASMQKHIKHEIHCIVFRHLLEHIDTPREFLEDVVKLIAQDGIIYVEVPNMQKHIKHEIHCIVFRHLLEHIDTPREFLEDVVKLIAQDGIIYVEVPNMLEFFENARFYEISYDHCGYYQKSMLINIFNEIGCEHIDTLMLYRNQHLGLFFKKKTPQNVKDYTPAMLPNNTYMIMQNAIQKLNIAISKYKRIALYGAGGHGHSLLSFLTLENRVKIVCCYDLDTRKHGKYLQNSKIVVTKPCKETYKDIECIILAAPLYEEEIVQYLQKDGFSGEILKSLNCR